MTVRVVESRLPPNMTAANFGETSAEKLGPSGEQFVLVSYLTSPVPEKTKLDYVVFALPPAGSNLNLWLDYVNVDKYIWVVTSTSNPTVPVVKKETDIGIFNWTPEKVGQYKISVEIQLGGATLATLELDQKVKARDAQLEALIKATRTKKTPSTQADAQRELINDLRDYIIDAAKSTGPNGIPARLLAAVLFMEIWARPKEGTANAKVFRKRIGGKANPTWVEWTADEIREKLGLKRAFGHLDDIRCVEIELVAEAFDDKWAGRLRFMGGKSIGVGQISFATSAMTRGIIPWLDQPAKGNKQEVRDKINDNWKPLPLWTKVNIFNLLRFPKPNITLAAELLAKLKNRPNRWPNLSADKLWRDKQAVGVLATEYHLGATDSSQADAKPDTDNGKRAPIYVQNGSIIFPEKYFL